MLSDDGKFFALVVGRGYIPIEIVDRKNTFYTIIRYESYFLSIKSS